MSALRAVPGAGLVALVQLGIRSGALRHPLAARNAARRGLPGVISLAARRNRDAVALLRGDETVTAGQLDDEVRSLTVALARVRGARVGVRSDGGIGFVVTLAAAIDAGGDVVPLGPRLAPADLAALGLAQVLEPRRGTARSVGSRNLRSTSGRSGRLLLLTTGTTGTPVATARGRMPVRALAQLADADRRVGLPHGPLLLLAPPDHGHGLSTLLGAMLHGIPVILAAGLSVNEQVALVERHHPVSISGVPAQLARLVDADGIRTARVIVSGSAPLPAELRTRLEAGGAVVHDGFGSTQTGTFAIDGRLVAGVRLRTAPDGSLEVRTPLGASRWIATGDRVDVRGGRLHATGRVGSLVDSGGELVDPARLRRLLSEHPGVACAEVRVVPDDLLGAVLHARVDADPALETALRDAFAAQLSRAEHPRRLEFGPIAAD
ncbi:MAG: AMP-binding protein [Pseudolysinimonas sp.]|uniref:AMP-binding protein n=1 Tax=Pseudolysinimonas sp. TaxID=2680009 RepID=UPI0032671061